MQSPSDVAELTLFVEPHKDFTTATLNRHITHGEAVSGFDYIFHSCHVDILSDYTCRTRVTFR